MIARVHRIALALSVACSLLAPDHGDAQERARRAVAAGEVTGLEMSIEGALHAAPGGHVRWLVTTYEVLHRRDLRVAGGVQLAVTASFSAGAALVTTTSDANGHAVLDIALPEDLLSDPSLSVEAISARGIRRTFDASVTRDPRTRIELVVDRDTVPPGGSIALLGRVLSGIDGRPRADAAVEIALREGALVRAPITVQADEAGVFVAEVALPDVVGAYDLEAASDDARARVAISTRADTSAPLWVRAVSTQAIARPGQTVAVDVLVRDVDGGLVEGARIEWTDASPPAEADVVRTGADGHAALPWSIDRFAAPDGGFEDRVRTLRVVHAAHGTGEASAHVRIARNDVFLSWSVEGGTLARELRSHLFVRATRVDGSAAVLPITLAAGALGAEHTSTTDADGVVSFDVVASAAPSSASGCGGPTSVLATLSVDGVEHEVCLPVEPDALVAVHAERVRDQIAVALARRPEVEARSIAIVMLVQHGSAWEPVSRQVIGPHQTTALLSIPPSRAPVWVRARPIVDGEEVVGGGTVVFAFEAPVIDAFTASAALASLSAPASVGSRAIIAVEAAIASDLEARVAGLTTTLAAAVARGRSALYVAALAASMVPRDTAASAVLREGAVSALSMPDDAPAQGLLRDPWRTRARFVRGRLGALMRSVEQLVDARVPDQIDQVGVRENGTWRFDREMLEAAMAEAGLGDERAAALDGEPLDIAALTALDPSFTYDHAARRITRARLFRVLWFLRQLVRERELDLAWARPGDPREYPVSLHESDVSWQDEYPQREHLFDAWGHPFVLVPVHGHARFERFQPVPGFELLSAGPDGRLGNADDVFDPFARVLESGTVYAEAVQEDELVARLGSVELGRATIAVLAEAFSYSAVVDYDLMAPAAHASWGTEPTLLPDASAMALARTPSIVRALFANGDAIGGTLTRTWSAALERHHYVALGLAFDAGGGVALRARPFEAGAPLTVHVELPDALRVGDVMRIPVRTVALTTDAPADRSLSASASSSAIAASVDGTDLVIEARSVGVASVQLVVEAAGMPPLRMESSVRILPLGSLRAAHAAVIGSGELAIGLRAPEGAAAWRSRWVIGLLGALADDPLFAEGDGHDAALSAWAGVVGRASVSADDRAALEHIVSVAPSGLHTACALVAWADMIARRAQLAGDASVEDARHPGFLRALDTLGVEPRFQQALGTLSATIPPDPAARAAMLAALAPAAPAIGDMSSAIAQTVALLRDAAWNVLATERDRPTTLAETAAALLLVDRDDAMGRALFERARAATDPAEGFTTGTSDDLAGTLALAIAARQIDEDVLADALALSAIRRLHLAPRLSVETRFWALAASSFGALRGETPRAVTIEVDGVSTDVSLDSGVSVLDHVSPTATVRVRSDGRVFVRGELRALVPYAAQTDLALDARIDGDVGVRGDRAGLELVIEATGEEAIAEPIVEIALPSLAAFDAAARASIAGASAVVAIEGPDGAGVLRLSLAPLRAHGTHRVALPLRWRASGRAHGLGVVVYDRMRPWLMTTRAERMLEVGAP